MSVVTVGLIKGRHEMPVDEYIFDSVENVLDFSAIHKVVCDFVENRVGISTSFGNCVNQNDYTDIQRFVGKSELVVYVTGLTPVVASLIEVCARNGVCLTLMHFNVTDGTYVPQVMNFSA